MDPRLKRLREQARLILYWQFGIVAAGSLVVLCWGLKIAYSFLLGGSIGLIPNALFARLFLVTNKAREAERIVKRFFLAEFAKWLMTIIMFFLVMKFCNANLLVIVGGFATSQLVFWIAPVLLIGNRR